MSVLNELSTFKFYELRKFSSERTVKKNLLNLLILLRELQQDVKSKLSLFRNKNLMVENLQFCEHAVEEFTKGVFLARVTNRNIIITLSNTSKRLGQIAAAITNMFKTSNEEYEVIRQGIVKHWNKIIKISKRYSNIKYEGTGKTYRGIEEQEEIGGVKIIKAA